MVLFELKEVGVLIISIDKTSSESETQTEYHNHNDNLKRNHHAHTKPNGHIQFHIDIYLVIFTFIKNKIR